MRVSHDNKRGTRATRPAAGSPDRTATGFTRLRPMRDAFRLRRGFTRLRPTRDAFRLRRGFTRLRPTRDAFRLRRGFTRLRPTGDALRLRRGFTLIECLAALIVLAIGLVGVFSLFVAGMATHKKGIDQTTAGTLGQKIIADLQASLDDDYLKRLADLAARTNPQASRNPKRKIELKDLTDPDVPDLYKYDLTLTPIESQRREAYAVVLRVKWKEGGVEQGATFETVVLRKLER